MFADIPCGTLPSAVVGFLQYVSCVLSRVIPVASFAGEVALEIIDAPEAGPVLAGCLTQPLLNLDGDNVLCFIEGHSLRRSRLAFRFTGSFPGNRLTGDFPDIITVLLAVFAMILPLVFPSPLLPLLGRHFLAFGLRLGFWPHARVPCLLAVAAHLVAGDLVLHGEVGGGEEPAAPAAHPAWHRPFLDLHSSARLADLKAVTIRLIHGSPV